MSNKPPRTLFIFIGPPHHGKTLARKIFCELTGLKGGSCSDVIYAIMSHYSGKALAELQASDKEELRPKLIELGDYLCGQRDDLPLNSDITVPDEVYRGPSALLRALFHNGVHAYDGVRRRDELEHFKAIAVWLGFDSRVIWVERPDVESVSDNTEVSHVDADAVISNDGTPGDLRVKIEALIVPPQGEVVDQS